METNYGPQQDTNADSSDAVSSGSNSGDRSVNGGISTPQDTGGNRSDVVSPAPAKKKVNPYKPAERAGHKAEHKIINGGLTSFLRQPVRLVTHWTVLSRPRLAGVAALFSCALF